MDPVGFALENYDAIGRWREFDEGESIDVSGVLPDGVNIRGVGDLESGILQRPKIFVESLTAKLLIFALGRGIEPADGPAIRKAVAHAEKHDYAFSSLIVGITASQPFQMREFK